MELSEEERLLLTQLEVNRNSYTAGILTRRDYEIISHLACKGYIEAIKQSRRKIRRASEIFSKALNICLITTTEYVTLCDELHEILETTQRRSARIFPHHD